MTRLENWHVQIVFPHICAGKLCAVCKWVVEHEVTSR